MVHAIINDMLTPDEARAHIALLREHVIGADGARLFDRPLEYRGGPQRLFQRAESSTFFGREIGLMYVHAHLRYAEAMAHLGDVGAFYGALLQAIPVGLRDVVPHARLRQLEDHRRDAAREERDGVLEDLPRDRVRSRQRRLAGGLGEVDGGKRHGPSLLDVPEVA
jgi:CRISPR-associated protein Csx3